MSKTFIIGLDGEMSGADIEKGCGLIQAGFANYTNDGLNIFSRILNPGEMTWQEKAATVHNIPLKTIQSSPDASIIDKECKQWLLEQGAKEGRREVITTGFNVGAFDLPFFRKYLPETMSLISRRSIDLNSLCFTLEGWDPNPTAPRDWLGWKRSAKKYAAKELDKHGWAENAHDAGWDAGEAIYALRWLQGQIHQCKLNAKTLTGPGAVFGPGLDKRLTHLNEPVRQQLAMLFMLNADTLGEPSAWLGKRRTEFENKSGLELLTENETGLVLQMLEEKVNS